MIGKLIHNTSHVQNLHMDIIIRVRIVRCHLSYIVWSAFGVEWRGKRQTAVSGSRAANQGDGKFDWSSLRKRRIRFGTDGLDGHLSQLDKNIRKGMMMAS